MSQAQFDAIRPKRRRTRADAVEDRLKAAKGSVLTFGVAAQTAIMFRLGYITGKAAPTTREQGELDLIMTILDELENPGCLVQRVLDRIGEASAKEGDGSCQASSAQPASTAEVR